MIRILGDTKSISANATRATVVELQAPDGKKYKVVEIALKAAGTGYFEIFYDTHRICEKISKGSLDIDSRRIVVDWEIQPGHKLGIYFTEQSGSANTAYYLLVFEEEKV